MPVKVFFCYAREDITYLKKLKSQLQPLQRQGLLDVWYDRDISAGTEWEKEIKEHLNTAQIILLLISPAFMSSDYAYGIEMQRALERHERKEARVIPIIIRPIDWQSTPLGKLQALPTDVKLRPVTDSFWGSQDNAFFNVARGIRNVVEDLNTKSVTDALITLVKNAEDLKLEPSDKLPITHRVSTDKSELADLESPRKYNEFALVDILIGHSGLVDSVTFSPDEDVLASSSEDKTIKLWNLYTKKPIYSFQEASEYPRNLAYSPDGQTLIGSGTDYTKLWDPHIGKIIETFNGFSGFFDCLAFKSNGQTLISSAYNSQALVRDLYTGELLHTFEGHSEPVYCTALTPDGQTLASGSADATIKVWDLQTEKLHRTLMGHSAPIFRIIFSPDGQTLASISEDQTIKLWKLEARKPRFTFEEYSAPIWCLAFSPDGQILASGSADGIVKLWDVNTNQLLQLLKSDSGAITSIAFSLDGQKFATGHANNSITVFGYEGVI